MAHQPVRPSCALTASAAGSMGRRRAILILPSKTAHPAQSTSTAPCTGATATPDKETGDDQSLRRGEWPAAFRGRPSAKSRTGRLGRPFGSNQGRRSGHRELDRRRHSDARGNGGDRDIEPPLCRRQRLLHDRHAAGTYRWRRPGDVTGDLRAGGKPAGDRALSRTTRFPDLPDARRKGFDRLYQRREHPDQFAGGDRRPPRRHHRARRTRHRRGFARHFPVVRNQVDEA